MSGEDWDEEVVAAQAPVEVSFGIVMVLNLVRLLSRSLNV